MSNNGTSSNGNDYSHAKFRPRYSAQDSSDDAFEEVLRDRRDGRCMVRKRLAVTILLLLAFTFVVGVLARVYLFFIGMRGGRLTGDIQMLSPDDLQRNESSSSSLWNAWKKKDRPDKTYNRARYDSYGFFNAISDDEWEKMKHETKTAIDMQDGTIMQTSSLLSESGANIDSNVWWVDNWKINFTCQNKVIIGGKSICDPKRMISIADDRAKPKAKWGRKKRKQKQNECALYVSGGRGIEFGNHFLDYSLARIVEMHSGEVVGKNLLPCEVHIFTPNGQHTAESRDGLFFHHWGFRPSNKESMGVAADNTTSVAFKTLEETIFELQHSGRVTLLALDCEACEWDIYPDILALDEPIQQVLMQMHGTPFMANELFLAMQEGGYVIFHREEEFTGSGEVYDYSWLKLSPSFFNWRPQ